MKKILILCGGIFLFSCSNENVEIDKTPENKIFSIQDYFDFIKVKTKNSLLIQNYSNWYTPNTSSSISTKSVGNANGLFFKVDGTEYSSTDVTVIDNNSGWMKSGLDLSNVYGKNVKIGFGVDQTSLTNAKTTSVYIPFVLKTDFFNFNQDEKVVAGTTVTWNIDKGNTKGVVLALLYSPMSQSNQSIALAYPKIIMNGKTIEDIGSYTITAEDLSAYPDNAALDFIIGRGNFVIINDGNLNNDLSVGAFSEVRTRFKIDKPK